MMCVFQPKDGIWGCLCLGLQVGDENWGTILETYMAGDLENLNHLGSDRLTHINIKLSSFKCGPCVLQPVLTMDCEGCRGPPTVMLQS